LQLLIKPWEALLSVKFLLGKKNTNYISFTSWASIFAMQLSVMTLIIVLSVMNGFREIIENIYVSADAEIQISGNETLPYNWDTIRLNISEIQGVVAISAWLEKQGLMLSGENANPLLVRGVLPDQERKIIKFKPGSDKNIFSTLQPDSRGVVVGSAMARAFDLRVGSRISLLLPKAGRGSVLTAPDVGNFVVLGVFTAQDTRANQNMIYMHLHDLQGFIGAPKTVLTGLQVAVTEMEQAPAIANKIRQRMPQDLRVLDWQQKNATQYKAIKFEKLMMTIMLSMIVLISCFNIVATTVMTVHAKRGEIAILMTYGAREGSIARIFIFNGFLLGIFGVVFGVGSGVLLAPNIGDILAQLESWFSFKVFDPNTFDIVHIPTRLEWRDVGVVSLLAFGSALLSTVYPAIQAARVDPAQALRYE
jgi:lipoprotein-releasing system permease protein